MTTAVPMLDGNPRLAVYHCAACPRFHVLGEGRIWGRFWQRDLVGSGALDCINEGWGQLWSWEVDEFLDRVTGGPGVRVFASGRKRREAKR